jgi:DNA-binding response OmpR family regulator
VVEDDLEAAQFFQHVLTKHGQFHVTHTADPGIALALAATEPWDLVLTDLDLPVMSGMELLAGLRHLAPRLPVVLVTAHLTEPASVTHGARPDKILRKPIPTADLLAAVTPLIPGRS